MTTAPISETHLRTSRTPTTSRTGLPDLPLPAGVRSRFVAPVNGLRMHVLEAGSPGADRLVLLLHGFPELAFSWRHALPALADAGYYVVAPDLRGYGRTTGFRADAYADPINCSLPWLVNDLGALVAALGRSEVHAVVGHDFGSFLAAWCGLLRPDVFRAVMMMSAPFAGPPAWPALADDGPSRLSAAVAGLPALGREHYQWYYSTPRAARDMDSPPQGMHDFLRAYFHVKSADWQANQSNRPHDMGRTDAETLARLPHYYVLPLGVGMPAAVGPEMPTPKEVASCEWLPDEELAVYTGEFSRTGFQGGLQWYRCLTGEREIDTLRLFGGRTIDVPSGFIAGDSDWAVHQVSGAFAAMQQRACTQMLACDVVPGAGHWVQQEQPRVVLELLLRFLERL
ncbi:alpha/beta fold hydrolase [Streptomyces sp. NPDC002156]